MENSILVSWLKDWQRCFRTEKMSRGRRWQRDSIRTQSRAHVKVWQLAHVLYYRKKKMPLGYTVLSRNNEQNEMFFTCHPTDLFKIGSKFFMQCLVGREFCLKSNNMHNGPYSEPLFSAWLWVSFILPSEILECLLHTCIQVPALNLSLSVLLSHFCMCLVSHQYPSVH